MRKFMKNGCRWGVWLLIILISFIFLGGSYWLYYRSIEQAVYSTTFSFMEQIADHDHLSVINQIDNKMKHLQIILDRIEASRENKFSFEDFLYNLAVEAKATSFNTFYLITEDDEVYSNAYLKKPLQSMLWAEEFQQADGSFITRYDEASREKWGEFLLCGIHLSTPISYDGKAISGVVGLVPITEISSQMRLESFDGQGIAVVMQKSGDIITASQQYHTTDKNFLVPLEDADFKNGVSYESCRQAVAQGENLTIEYSTNGGSYYALLQPLNYDGRNDWYLVVRVSTQVTSSQIDLLLSRSLPFFLAMGVLILFIAYFIYHTISKAKVSRASEHAKSTFLANMSHEIRTPLNGIVGLQYLMRQNLDDRKKLEEYLKKAEVSASFLQNVITDVLDMSKIESGQLELYPKEMDLRVVVEDVHILLENQVAGKGLQFSVDCRQLEAPLVLGDALRLKQILTNLLGNAVKFTPERGSVSLTVSQKLSGDTAATMFQVADTGCGMSPEFLTRIWRPFEQERRIAAQNGTGLGTTLSKTLVEKMGGSIAVESQLGKGTVFTFSIPFPVIKPSDKEDTSTDTAGTPWPLAGKHILAVEDNELNRMIIVSILENKGCKLIQAGNGQEALDIFKASSPSYFDLILMDIQMPVLDGYEATRRIRSLPRPDAQAVPIIAMTANAFIEDVEKALAAGMNDVATKPLDIQLLLKKIEIIKNQEEPL